MKHKIAAAVMMLIAAALVLSHLHMPYNTRSFRMETSAAAARSGEKMTVSMPQGDVDVNRASAQELEALEGVGPVLAQAIIDEREKNGDFHYPEDLINVKGIGEKTLEKMLEQLKLP